MGPRALDALDAIIDDPSHPRHEQCLEYVMNRWKGAPVARAELSGPDGGPIETRDAKMTREELRREIERAESRAGTDETEDDPPPDDGAGG